MGRLEWDREIALPLYQYLIQDDVPPWEPAEPDEHGNAFIGRLVIWTDARCGKRPEGHPPTIPMPPESVANLGPQDIVFVPLWDGQDPTRAMTVEERLPAPIYDANLEALYEIAPRVKAVIMGNCGPEMCFCDIVTGNQHATISGRDAAQVERLRRRHIDFIDHAAALVKDAGGLLALAPVPAEFMFDMYMLKGELRELMLSFGAAFVQFLGFGEWDQQMRPNLQWSPNYCPLVREGCSRRDLPPEDDQRCERICSGAFSPNVAEYLKGFPLTVCAMEFRDGLVRGNDVKAREHGYHAGFVGGF